MRKIKSILMLFCLGAMMPLISCVKNSINLQDPYEKINRAMFGFDQAVDYLVYQHVCETKNL